MMLRILVWLVLLPRPGAGQGAPTAADLLLRMQKTYADARTYRDRGKVTVDYITDKKVALPRLKAFSTAFVRGNGLRFAFAEPTPDGAVLCGVVWNQGTRTLAWQGFRNAVDSSHTLPQALSLVGVASGLAPRRTVGLLLGDPKISLNWVKALRNVQVLGQETVGNRATYHLSAVTGESIFESQIHLWLDAASGLLIRLTERSKIAEYEALTTIELEPAIDVELTPDLLRFDYQHCLK